MPVSTWAKSTADALIRSATTVDSTTSAFSSIVWIGSRVRIKRTSRGMTQEELSARLGIDPDNLADYEAGEKRINANLLLRIANLLDVRPDYFFRGYKDEDWKTL
jgi:ribosome-binding protein aMBF1 (putative translation factor)